MEKQDAFLQWIHDIRGRIEFTLAQSLLDFNEEIDKGSLPYEKVSEQFSQAYTSLVNQASDIEIACLVMSNVAIYEVFEETVVNPIIAVHVGNIKIVG